MVFGETGGISETFAIGLCPELWQTIAYLAVGMSGTVTAQGSLFSVWHSLVIMIVGPRGRSCISSSPLVAQSNRTNCLCSLIPALPIALEQDSSDRSQRLRSDISKIFLKISYESASKR